MTKQDYIIIAKCLNNVYAPAWEYIEKNPIKDNKETPETTQALQVVYTVGQVMGEMFKAFPIDNPKFDWQKFKKAVYK